MAATGRNYEIGISASLKTEESKKNINNALKQIETQVKNIGIKFDVKTADIKKVAESADSLKVSFQDVNGAIASITRDAEGNFSKVRVSVGNTNKALKDHAQQIKDTGYSWSKAWEGASKYFLVTGSIVQVKRMIGSMVESVISLDDSLVELQKVTNLEGSSLDEFTKKAYDAGTTVAKTGTEMIDAATSFAKAGYDEESILQLGKVANMYTNIADEEISAADSADFIIAQLKAFKLEAEDTNTTLQNSEHIIDAVGFC